MKRVIILTALLSSMTFAETAQEKMDRAYAEWSKKQEITNQIQVVKQDKKKIYPTAELSKAELERKSKMDIAYKKWSKKKYGTENPDLETMRKELENDNGSFSNKIKNASNNSRSGNIAISKVFSSYTGKCSIVNNLDNSILMSGECNVVQHLKYPVSYSISFPNSREFYFQEDKEKNWVFMDNGKDKSVSISENKNNLKFSTKIYTITIVK